MPQKAVLVTNANRWLGTKLMLRLVDEGYKVFVLDESETGCDTFSFVDDNDGSTTKMSWANLSKRGIVCFHGRSNDEMFIQKVAKSLKEQNIELTSLVMYPSIFQEKTIDLIDADDIDTFFQELIEGPVLLLKTFLPTLRKNKGCVELISSSLAVNPEPSAPIYSIMQSALIMLVKCLTITEKNVRINSVLTGPALSETVVSVYNNKSLLDDYMKYVPSGKPVLHDDIVEQAICHIKCGSCYGSLSAVDGGESHSNIYSYVASVFDTKSQAVNTKKHKNRKKTVFVTGGSSGIGLATVKKFLRCGYKVYVLDIKSCPYKKATTFLADVRIADQVKQAIGQIDNLDVLVNCAGIYELGFISKGQSNDFRGNISNETFESVKEASMQQLKDIFDINVRGYLLVTRYVIALLKKSSGNIIMVSSGLGDKPEPTSILYCMTKSAINAMVRCAADSDVLIGNGIRVNGVLPGPVDTPLLVNAFGSKENAQKYYDTYNPLGIVLSPEEVAESIYFTLYQVVPQVR